MSLKTKLALIFSAIVSFILIMNNTLHYIYTKNIMQESQLNLMELTAKEISIAIKNSQEGAKYIEDLIGKNLRTASLVAKYALDPNIENVSNEELQELSKEIGISHISLFKRVEDDIKVLKSSDPHEIGISAKDWGFWYDALNQLLDDHNVSIPQGQKLPNYWSGQIDVSNSSPEHVDKWGYFYDGTTDYIIDPYVRDVDIREFENITGLETFLNRTLEENSIILEITGFNPEAMGKQPIMTKANGVEFLQLVNRPVVFGSYQYRQENKDLEYIKQALELNEQTSYTTVLHGKHVVKSFFPVTDAAEPYVIGLVTDYKVIQNVLYNQLKSNISISLLLLLVCFLGSYLLSKYMVRPLQHIMQKVNEISNGNFGTQIVNSRRDELGILTNDINIMSENLEEYTNQIEYQANYDALTDLPNRRMFNKTLEHDLQQAKANQEKLAVMFLDLDRFKSINDVYGHSIGDLLLKSVADRLKYSMDPEDFISRIGGDEFTIILSNTDLEKTEEKAKRVLNLLTLPYYIKKNELFITPSIGISVYPDHGEDMETLVKNADTTMYRAKEQGKNRFQFFTTELSKTVAKKAQLEKDLRKALSSNQFVIHYQPQVNLNTGEIIGVEALLRWNHPKLGLISPTEFIPIAEESGLIVPIGESVLKQSCMQIKRWQEKGFPSLRLSVNLSVRQFQKQDFVKTVRQIIHETGIDPSQLKFEITEGIAMQFADHSFDKVVQLREIGVQIAIDDFGTGYSSLNYLKKVPINTLKIDKSFVHDIENDPDNNAIVTTIISMAHNLNLNVIAEGVESKKQTEYLKQEHCHEAQGFLFGKPLPAEEFEDSFESMKNEIAEMINAM